MHYGVEYDNNSRKLDNIWKCPIVRKASEYIVRDLLRFLLTPKRETSYKKLIQTLAEKKAAKKEEK